MTSILRSLDQRLDRLAGRAWFGDALVLVVCGGVLVVAALMSPSSEVVSLFGAEVPVLCGFRKVTGIPCPGCGLTRSFAFMAHGQVLQAFGTNLLGPPLFLLVASQVPWRGLRLIRWLRRDR